MLLTAYGLFFKTEFEKGFILSAGVHRNQRFRQKLECANYWARLASVRLLSLRVLARLNACHYTSDGLRCFDVFSARNCHFVRILLLSTRGCYLKLFSNKECGLDPR